ncbi:MAG: lamin tail domain-containing protein, partial [Myxococcales bacterium]|nr:lamin tail domain-containing protein [Myxococcales bacterium]
MRSTMRMRVVSVVSLLWLAACSGAAGPGAEGGSEETGATSTGGATTGPTPTTSAADSEPPADTGTAEGGGDKCGDGKVDDGELCDGADLDGKACSDLDAAYIGGTLACAADCGSFDASGCEIDPNVALVALNELSSQGATEGPYAGKGDVIELYNAGGAAADLSGWKLSDDPRFPADKTYVFAPGTTLAPGSFLVLVAYDEVTMTGELPFGIADDKEETITLVDA